jgi:2-polyprenyl-6-methoxyphenol hydroxylase-like FAD-dependent oxidoreductase
MYDVIVVGARCAGAPLAMLLARKGHKVLVVDRSTFPSDVLHSTLLIHQPGVALLKQWGLLERVQATGCPPIRNWHVDFGPLVFKGSPLPKGEVKDGYAPRRFLLDKILVDAAREAGAEVREGVTLGSILPFDGQTAGITAQSASGQTFTERAKVIVGADGVNSTVAKKMNADEYQVRPALISAHYTYFSGVKLLADTEFYIRNHRAIFSWPTNHDQVLIGVNWKADEFDGMDAAKERSFFNLLEEIAPDLARRVRAGKREGEIVGGKLPRNCFRKPFGPGWALVGDASAFYEYSTAQGITNAFRQAAELASSLDDGLAKRKAMEVCLVEFQRKRDEVELPFYDFTYQQGTFQPPPPEAFALFGAIHKSEEATRGFFSLFTQTLTPMEFFAPANMQKIMGGGGH